MSPSRTELRQARFKEDPSVTIDIAYRVTKRYYQEGKPEIDYMNPESDDWFSEGTLSGGKVSYVVYGINDDSPIEYEYTDDEVATPEGWDANCTIKWGRCSFSSPGHIRFSIRYNDQWSHHQCLEQSSVDRRFVPACIRSPTRPHVPANRDMIAEWLNEFIDRPRDALGVDDVRFVGGDGAVEQVKDNIANHFVSPKTPDIVSPEYLTGRFEISYRLVFDILDELLAEDKISRVHHHVRYHEAIGLYGAASEWETDERIPKDGDVTVRIHR